MIDWHTHILPYMDDGSKSEDMSFEMLEKLREQGVDEIFATPHFYLKTGESVPDFLARRKSCYEKLSSHSFFPHIHLGAEVAISVELAEVADLELLKLDGTNCILLEPPYEDWQDWVFRTVFTIHAKYRIKPIIAHVDRYFDIVKDKKKIWKLMDMGCIIQINTSAFRLSRFHPVFKLINEAEQLVLGTDTHNMSTRLPDIEEKMQRKRIGLQKMREIEVFSRGLFR